MPPLICTSHGGDLLGLNGRLLDLIKRWIIRRSTQLTLVSHAMVDRALSLGAKPEKLHVISMGVDATTLFTPGPATLRVNNEILFVGRLVEKKGVSYLLAAMPDILRRHPDIRLRIVGGGPEQGELQLLAERLGITDAITFHGTVQNDEIPDLYRRATVFVAPSIVTALGDQEGLGLVLVEALACECPVVATDLPALRDVVTDGVNGLICRQKDSADLAAKLCYLLEHPEVRAAMGRSGRQYVQNRFDWVSISSRYANLIGELSKGRA